MRIPLAASMESRDGNRSRDAQCINAIIEPQGENAPAKVRKRPGVNDQGLVKTGTAQLLYVWNGLKAIIGDFMNAGTTATITSGPVQTNLTPTNAGLPFYAQETVAGAATPRMFFRNRTQAWVIDRAGTITPVVYGASMGAGTYTLISLARVGAVATATLAEDVFNVGDSVTIAGATPPAYNGVQTVTGVTAGVAAASIPLVITRSGTTATARTADGSAHGLTSGSYVLSGATQAEYNGTFSITVTSTSTFTFTVTATLYPAITGTLNPADKSSDITLSGGNLIATNSGANVSARGTVGKSSGKWYFEVTITTTGSPGYAIIGVANATMPLNRAPGDEANGWGYGSNGYYGTGGGAISFGVPTFGVGDVVGIRLDMDLGVVTFYKNGVAVGSLSGLTGTIFPAVSPGQGGGVVTTNFAGTFTYDPGDPATTATGAPVVARTALSPTFSYAIGGSPATPATGTITAQGNGGTVPGIAYINGYFCVMDVNGNIYNSASDDPTSWPALNNVPAQLENGAGKAIAKSVNYLIALKEYSTEFFYDAKGTSGSPFKPVENGFTRIGCASGDSLAEVAGRLFFISQTRGKGRSVHMMQGMQQAKVSTPDIDRILDTAPSLSTVYAYGLVIDGHNLYVLTIVDIGLTMVYDVDAQHWGRWGSYTASTVVNVSSITRVGNVATVTTATAHGQADGSAVLLAGATQGEYNGYFPIQYVSATSFLINVQGIPATPATGTITCQTYSISYWKFTKAASANGVTYLLHESNGHIYQMVASRYDDAGVPILLYLITARMDGGTDARKKMPRMRVVGDTVADFVLIRWSDDDFSASVTNFQAVDMSIPRPELRRCGAFVHRNINLVHVGNKPIQLQALEVEISQ